jgi:hypothetical protein
MFNLISIAPWVKNQGVFFCQTLFFEFLDSAWVIFAFTSIQSLKQLFFATYQNLAFNAPHKRYRT